MEVFFQLFHSKVLYTWHKRKLKQKGMEMIEITGLNVPLGDTQLQVIHFEST